jgi:hypothetical protein
MKAPGSNFTEILPVAAELIHVIDGQKVRRKDKKYITGSFKLISIGI